MLKQKSYQAKQSHPNYFPTENGQAPQWFIIDAQDMIVGRLATVIARLMIGKHKPTFTRHVDTGDFVVVINADKVAFTADKWNDKIYRDYSGYIGGLKEKTAKEMLQRHPEEIIRRAVWGMTNKSSLARHQMKKLKIYAGSEHPHQAQQPQALPAGVLRRSVLAPSKAQS